MLQSQVPLKLRKQMLLMRAAVERVELAQSVLDVREAATISAIVRNALPGDRSRSLSSRVFEVIKRYPFMTSAASLLAARFRFPILAAVTKWGGAATIGYKLWELWRKHHPDAGDGMSRLRMLAARRSPR
jgi:threonine/homoserine/homoserine lactone efflux protein